MEENKQAAWNLSQHTIDLIANLKILATQYALGIHKKSDPDEISIPNHRKAYQVWLQIALLIDERLTDEQKRELKRLNNELVRSCRRVNPKYGMNRGTLDEEPKYQNITDKAFGVKSQKVIKYIEYLIKKVGMAIKDIDEDEGLM